MSLNNHVLFFHSSIISEFLLVLRLSVEDNLGQQLLPLLGILARLLQIIISYQDNFSTSGHRKVKTKKEENNVHVTTFTVATSG